MASMNISFLLDSVREENLNHDPSVGKFTAINSSVLASVNLKPQSLNDRQTQDTNLASGAHLKEPSDGCIDSLESLANLVMGLSRSDEETSMQVCDEKESKYTFPKTESPPSPKVPKSSRETPKASGISKLLEVSKSWKKGTKKHNLSRPYLHHFKTPSSIVQPIPSSSTLQLPLLSLPLTSLSLALPATNSSFTLPPSMAPSLLSSPTPPIQSAPTTMPPISNCASPTPYATNNLNPVFGPNGLNTYNNIIKTLNANPPSSIPQACYKKEWTLDEIEEYLKEAKVRSEASLVAQNDIEKQIRAIVSKNLKNPRKKTMGNSTTLKSELEFGSVPYPEMVFLPQNGNYPHQISYVPIQYTPHIPTHLSSSIRFLPTKTN